jgi:hypothetical protein
MVYPRNYPEENLVVKDAEYFDELRRAIAWTSPIALFGTSGLAVYQRIESAQDFELREQVNSEQLPAQTYSRYHSQIVVLRILTAVIPWLSIPLTQVYIMSLGLSAKDTSGLLVYGLIALVLIVEILFFLVAKFIQVVFWRLGSEAIRHRNGISSNSRLGNATSESDAPE